MKKTFELIQGNDCHFLNFFISNEWKSIRSTEIIELEFFIILFTDLDYREYRLFAKNENEIQEILEPRSSYTCSNLSKYRSGYVYLNKSHSKYLAVMPADKIGQAPKTFEFDFYDDFTKVLIKDRDFYKINFSIECGVEKDDTIYSYFSLEEVEKEKKFQNITPQKKWWQLWK